MNLYLYCLGKNLDAAVLINVTGLADAEPHLLTCDDITAVVSDFVGNRVPVSRTNVFAHTRVIDAILAQTTPLPFRFGTVVSQERLKSYLDSQRDNLYAMLDRVAGCVEMSVKVLWNPRQAQSDAVEGNQIHDAQNQEATPAIGPGTSFLEAKRRESLRHERQKHQANEIAAWIAGQVGTVVQESMVRVQPTEGLVMAAAYLVERERLKEYRECLDRVREARADLGFLASGPWPPYSFSEINS